MLLAFAYHLSFRNFDYPTCRIYDQWSSIETIAHMHFRYVFITVQKTNRDLPHLDGSMSEAMGTCIIPLQQSNISRRHYT